jgi:hypothetical protein
MPDESDASLPKRGVGRLDFFWLGLLPRGFGFWSARPETSKEMKC